VLSGVGYPSSRLGATGDFYIDTQSFIIYGPKLDLGSGPVTVAIPVWGAGVSLIGPKGATGPQGPEASLTHYWALAPSFFYYYQNPCSVACQANFPAADNSGFVCKNIFNEYGNFVRVNGTSDAKCVVPNSRYENTLAQCHCVAK
jgi:hypothetical protein